MLNHGRNLWAAGKVSDEGRAMRSYGNGAPDGKEILAEVFGVKLAEVDEMILSRFEAAGNEDLEGEENEPWPQEFCL